MRNQTQEDLAVLDLFKNLTADESAYTQSVKNDYATKLQQYEASLETMRAAERKFLESHGAIQSWVNHLTIKYAELKPEPEVTVVHD